MPRYILICPYFGSLPNNFQLWLNSCKYNSEIDFLIITDDMTNYEIPQNVKIIRMPFKKLQDLVKVKFPFVKYDIKPYKLCDYKPTYGYLFSDYIVGYDYWGNCDVDLIYGDLFKFLPTDSYDKISNLGHTTFYRNNQEINMAFMKSSQASLTYREILASDANFGFDEIGDYGIKNIFKQHNYTIYPLEKYAADVSPNSSNLILTHYDQKKDSFYQGDSESIISFENGHVFSYNMSRGSVQKRNMHTFIFKRE